MYGRSAAFDNQVRHGGVVTTKADIYRSGALLAADLQVISGGVSVDATAAIRRRCQFTVIDSTGVLIPSDAADSLAPYGNEARLYRGYGTELLPLGVFRIESSDVVDNGAQTVAVTGYDRSSTIAEARFETPYIVAANVNYGTAIQDLITSRFSGLTYNFTTTTRLTPSLLFEQGSDPWQAAQKMAQNIGSELFFDVDGVCVLRPEPTGTGGTATWTYADDNQSTTIEFANFLRAKPAYNRAIVSGESTSLSAPVRAEATDLDPASPTYYHGPFGKRPVFYVSQYITSQAQAQEAANALLQRELGGTEQLQLTAIPHPATEAGDLIRVVRQEIGVDVFALIEAFDMPLSHSEPMRLTTKARRSV